MEEELIKIEVEIAKDTNLYISDILCWLRGYLEGKEEDFQDRFLLEDACNKLSLLNKQLRDK